MTEKKKCCKICGTEKNVTGHRTVRLDSAQWSWKKVKLEPFIVVINTDLVSRDMEFCRKCFAEIVYMAHWELIAMMRKGETDAST